ncbi:DNA internalization-related competence protein ComEC/Rec2 [Staphylococcus chromogenes]|nr:DNA internalization-related competence protein ComEC/Rec2 [Staphylococcus chromogenes]
MFILHRIIPLCSRTPLSSWFSIFFYYLFFLILSQKWLSKQNLYLVLWKTTLVSFYGTLSISYHHFNEIQWQSIITNIVFVPLYSFIIIPFAFLTIPMYLISPHIIENISILPNTLFQFQEALLQMFQPLTKFHWVIANYGEPGFLMITFCSFISMLLLNLKKYRYYLIFTVIAIFFSIVFKPSFTDEMILIDVGQGDAILFKSRTHKTLLIDTGGQLPHLKQRSNFNITERKLYPTLKSKGITQIDYLLITHDHADHMGELKELADKVTIKNIIINPHHFNRDLLHEVIDITKSEQAILHSAFELKTLKLDEFQFQFLNATIKNSENPNEHSIITLANIYNNRILLMGDATVANEDLLRQKYNIPKINILKVGHHGSKTSTSENFLATIRPEIALISSGKNNMYRLPHPEILERLSKQDIATYNTAENQNLTIQFTSENYTLSKAP